MASIKKRNEVLNDIIRDGKKHPKNWNAVFGKDNQHLSKDYYVFNPNVGMYLIKEYQKSPYEVKGIGGKVARHIDEGVENEITKYSNDFGILQGNLQKILKNVEKGVHPKKIFESAVKGKKDLGLKMPIKGQASSSKKSFENVHNELSKKQEKIDKKFKKVANEDGLYRSYD